jgi:hypothetical protein
MDVAAADSAGGDPHEYFSRRWGGGIDVGHGEGAGRGKKKSLHW